jgi:hypothetical protein
MVSVSFSDDARSSSRRAGLGMRKPTRRSRRLSKNFADRVRQVVRQLARPEPDKPLKVLAFDEARFGLINWHRKRYCPKGFRPPYIVRRAYKWTYLYAAVEPTTGGSFCLYLPGMDRGCLQGFSTDSPSLPRRPSGSRARWCPEPSLRRDRLPQECRFSAPSDLLSRTRSGRAVVPRVQARVVQQSLRDCRATA